jgi:hypothetical protein
MHVPKNITRVRTTNITHAQTGNPNNTAGRRGFFSTGLGRSAWQRQQTRLSSGFHVPHFGQSILHPAFLCL